MPFKFNPFTKKLDYYETGGGGGASWGSITGNLQDQTDLKNALDSKAGINHNHNLADLSEKSYNSLTDKPTIPTKTSELTNDSGFISSENDPVWNSEKTNYYTKTETDNLLDGKSDTSHTHTKSNITDLENITVTPASNSIPKSDASGKIDNGWLKTGSGNGLDADTLDGQHASGFASVSHNHDDRYYTETELSTSGGGGQVHWDNVTSKPSTFPPSSHTHLLADITNAGALASKNTISTNDVDNDAITYAKIQNVSTNNRFLGRVSSGAGDIEELTASQAKSILAITKSDISDFAHQSTHQSGGSDAITGNLDAIARTTIRKNSGTNIGSRRRLNFIEGSNVTITATDDPTDEEIDITISASGGGGGGVGGSGSGGQVAFWTSETNISGDNNFFWDNTNKRLGIGTTNPQQKLDINGNINFSSGNNVYFSSSVGYIRPESGGFVDILNHLADSLEGVRAGKIQLASFYEQMVEPGYGGIHAYGNAFLATGAGRVGIGTTNPSYKLDVNGDLRVSGTTTLNGVTYTWPASGGSSGQVLTTNGSGTLSWTTPSGGGLSVLVKTSNQSNSTTTGADISDLTVSLAANQKMFFHAYLVCSSAATTTGIQLAINGPASPTTVDATIIGWTSATAIATTGVNAYETYQANTASAGTTRRVFEIFGIIVNGSNSGTFALRFRSEVAGSAVTVHAGSYMHYYIS